MILICYGTRPEYLKVKPLIDQFSGAIPFKTLFTGQHRDLVDARADYEIEIKQGRNRLDSIVSSIMNCVEYEKEGITDVLVQGDTTSAFAVALTAFHNNLSVIHLEAGLRTYNLKHPYPEEANRQMISRIANIHLCPTEDSRNSLVSESVFGQVEVVGNTVLDNLKNIKVSNEKKVLVTMHRNENQKIMEEWFENINNLAVKYHDYEFLLPIHPNPSVKRHSNILKNVKVVEPMEHKDLIDYLSRCSYVITDSGGIQEESSFLGKPCLVCRKETERSEGLGNFSILCGEPSELDNRFEELDSLKMHGPCPYGDGHSSEKILKIIKRNILERKK
jgi:UDP-N-acetylglucosamine 2-epimerase (non-hydrolysing)|tara:strand:+ start:12035 stop:13033 length:999 start_codon:yes stop_codon:yes gene_type:complete